MKRFKASDLTHNRAEVMKEAKVNGVIIECRNTNGEVVDELVMTAIPRRRFDVWDCSLSIEENATILKGES